MDVIAFDTSDFTGNTDIFPRATKQIVSVSAYLHVLTPDGLKKLTFGLTKGIKDGVTTWAIGFEFYSRASRIADFGQPLVRLDVDVQLKYHELAETTAVKGLNRNQVKQAITRTAPTAERFLAGKTTQVQAKKAVQSVLAAREAA